MAEKYKLTPGRRRWLGPKALKRYGGTDVYQCEFCPRLSLFPSREMAEEHERRNHLTVKTRRLYPTLGPWKDTKK